MCVIHMIYKNWILSKMNTYLNLLKPSNLPFHIYLESDDRMRLYFNASLVELSLSLCS